MESCYCEIAVKNVNKIIKNREIDKNVAWEKDGLACSIWRKKIKPVLYDSYEEKVRNEKHEKGCYCPLCSRLICAECLWD